MATCSVCKADLASGQVLFDQSAAVVCQRCFDSAEVKSLEARAATSTSKAAYGNLFIGVFSLFFNPFWLLTFAAIGNCAYVFRQIGLDQKRGEGPSDPSGRKAIAAVGAVLGVMSALLRVLIAASRP
jgi:hypothetical protein